MLGSIGGLQLGTMAIPFSFPSLTHCGKQGFSWYNFAYTCQPKFLSLAKVEGDFSIQKCNMYSSGLYDFPKLKKIDGTFSLTDNVVYVSPMSFGALETVGGTMVITGTSVKTSPPNLVYNFTSLQSVCEVKSTPQISFANAAGEKFIICPSNILPNLCRSIPHLQTVIFPAGCEGKK